ncbi:MAG: outer membrane beta-barrel family protein [Bacteroidota bacterium]
MKKIIFLFISLSLVLSQKEILAQSVSVQGHVVDTMLTPLTGATAVLLQAGDSVLYKFSISNGEGFFEMKKVTPGDYILQLTFLGYGNYSKPVTIGENTPVFNAGYIALLPENALLDEVTVKAEHIPMRLNKDTIEYNAAAFETKPNAAVEELLKKLPGVEVTKDGTIKAQGEEVNQVLVDGKQFFGNDPQVATKNLPADAIDKVQVFDKKSEMSEFTGVDDGQRDKTINLALKDDKKKGYFGKATAGYGTEDRYEAKLSLNRFDKKMQMSIIGMSNNNNQQGFSLGEYMNFMGGLQNMMHGGGGGSMRLSIEIDGGLPLGAGLSNGFVNSSAGGANFNLELGKNTDLNLSYFYNRIRNNVQTETTRQNFTENGVYDAADNEEQLSQSSGHKLNMRLQHEIDSFRRIIFRNSMGYNDGFSESFGNSMAFNTLGMLENDGSNIYLSEGRNFNLNGNVLFMNRFRKSGRAFSADLSYGLSDDDRESRLQSLNRFYLGDGNLNFTDSLNQRQDIIGDRLNYGLTLTHTEPLGKKRYLEFRYSLQNFQDENDKTVFDITGGPNPEENYNSHLSNKYKRDYLYNSGGLSFRLNRKKANFSVGLTLQHSRLRGDLFNASPQISEDYVNLLPNLMYSYDLATSRNIEFSYITNVREPSVEQLQPIVDNSNPLNIYIGNPELSPEYTHRAAVRFHSFSQFSMTSIFASLSGSYTTNKITNEVSVDSLFRQITRPVNVDNDFGLRSYFSFGAPLKFIKSRININNGLNYNRSLIFVNGTQNASNRLRTTLDISIENKNTELVEIGIGTNLSHNLTNYSDADNLNQNYFDQVYYIDAGVNFLKTWNLSSSFDYTIYGGEAFGSSETIPIWKASLSTFLLKNQKGELKFSASDLLNRNQGISRTSEFNYIEETSTRSLGRYFMVSFTYNISKFGARQGGGIEVIDGRRR